MSAYVKPGGENPKEKVFEEVPSTLSKMFIRVRKPILNMPTGRLKIEAAPIAFAA